MPTRWKKMLEKVPLDLWRKPFQYRYPGIHNPDSFDVFSWGPDGIESEDDIGNWR
ncbi:MAG: type II secretion system protein GspG [Verrucomicrobiota bacterium]